MKVMIYGADEFMGGLVLEESLATSPPGTTHILSGTGTTALLALGTAKGLEVRTFDWNDPVAAAQQLALVDVVVNAATPFEQTVEPLCKAAIQAGCCYVDVNTEFDAEVRLTRLDTQARAGSVTLASSAGPTGALSDLLVDGALTGLLAAGVIRTDRPIGTIRIAVGCLAAVSRSTVRSARRASGRPVTVLGVKRVGAVLRVEQETEPVGRRQRTFDMGFAGAVQPTICAAATLVDLSAAARAAVRHDQTVGRIECYVAMNEPSRLAYPLVAGLQALTGPAWLYGLEGVVDTSFDLLPGGPGDPIRRMEPYTIALTIEDELQQTVLDWRLRVPSLYDASAAVAARLAQQVVGLATRGAVAPSGAGVARLDTVPVQFPLPGVGVDRRLSF